MWIRYYCSCLSITNKLGVILVGIIRKTFITEQITKIAATNNYIRKDVRELLALDDKIQLMIDQVDKVSENEKSVASKWIESVNVEMYGKFPDHLINTPNITKLFFAESLTETEVHTIMYKFVSCSLSDPYHRGLDICKVIADYKETGMEAGLRLGFLGSTVGFR